MPSSSRVHPFAGILLTLQILRAATAGSISGTVLDLSGATIPGATPTATNSATGVQQTTTTKVDLNSNPRNRGLYYNASLFSPNAVGTPGTASRRSFYGPGMVNLDLALLRQFQIAEAKALEFRLESFNTFNHAQFFEPVTVDGDIGSKLFGPGGESRSAARTSGAKVYILIKVSGCSWQKPIR